MIRRSHHRLLAAIGSLCLLLPLFAEAQSRYALLIGIDKYTSPSLNTKELAFATTDALELEAVLDDRGWETIPIVDAHASRQRIIRELYKLSLAAGPNDRVLIYFAGHGVRDPRGRGQTYWLTTDASLDGLVSDGIRINHILEYVSEIEAAEKIVILDHCYSGDLTLNLDDSAPITRDALAGSSLQPPAERELFPVEVERLKDLDDSRLVIFAAARGPAYEDEAWGNGMFTKALLDVLNDPSSDADSNGKISLGELWMPLDQAIRRMAEEKNVEQNPLTSARLHEMGWEIFNAAVADFGAEAETLRKTIGDVEIAARGNLPIDIKLAYVAAISDWESSAVSGIDASVLHLKLVRALRDVTNDGVTSASLQRLVDRYLELTTGTPS